MFMMYGLLSFQPIENRIEEGAVKRSKDHSVTLPLDTFQKHPLGFKSVNGMTKGGSKGRQDGKLNCSLY